jgi:hypothetical protein
LSTVLIVANPADIHARFMRMTLERRGHDVRFLHMAHFARTATLSLRPGSPLGGRVTDRDADFDVHGIDAVWYRRRGRPELPEDVAHPDDRLFALREWDQALDGMIMSLDVKVVNPVAAQRAAVKPLQLTFAAACGLRVPDTLVTSDAVAAESFIAGHAGHVVHKAMSPARHQFLPTRRWHESDRSVLGNLMLAPVMFQEEITGHSDVRATVVGDRILAARVECNPALLDSRLSRSAYEPWRLPDDVSAQLLATMRELDLPFGTVDCRITHENEYVFFEVNPQGQFLYVEISTGLPITDTLAGLLVEPSDGEVDTLRKASW